MCWAVPAVVVKIDGDSALVDIGDGIPRPVVIGIHNTKVAPGTLVLVHAGVIISVLDLESLNEMENQYVELFRDLARLSGESEEEAVKEAKEAFSKLLERAKRYSEGSLEVEHGQFAVW